MAMRAFLVHYTWLRSVRWGVEAVANLGALPATGAILVLGGPSRVIALVTRQSCMGLLTVTDPLSALAC